MLNIIETTKGKVRVTEKVLVDFLQNGPEADKTKLISVLKDYADRHSQNVSKYQLITDTKKVVASTLGSYAEDLNIPFDFYRLGCDADGKLSIYRAHEKDIVHFPNLDQCNVYVQVGDIVYDVRAANTDLSGWDTQFYFFDVIGDNLFFLAEKCFEDKTGNNIITGYHASRVPELLPNS